MPWAFDTHADVRRLQAAGINEPQAEAIVATVYKAFIAHASTKTDQREVQVLLGAVFQAVFDVRVLWVPPPLLAPAPESEPEPELEPDADLTCRAESARRVDVRPPTVKAHELARVRPARGP